MTEVCVEERSLDDEVTMVYKVFGRRVRMAFDPTRTTKTAALSLLCLHLPHLSGAMTVVHRASR
jgi:hypothetical protein